MTIEQLLKKDFFPQGVKISDALLEMKTKNEEQELLNFISKFRHSAPKGDFDSFVSSERIFINERVVEGRIIHDSTFFIPFTGKLKSLSAEKRSSIECTLQKSGIIDEDVSIVVYESTVGLKNMPSTWYEQQQTFNSLEHNEDLSTSDEINFICGKIILVAEEDEHPCSSLDSLENKQLASLLSDILGNVDVAGVVFDPSAAILHAHCKSHTSSLNALAARLGKDQQVSVTATGDCMEVGFKGGKVDLKTLPNNSYFDNYEQDYEMQHITSTAISLFKNIKF